MLKLQNFYKLPIWWVAIDKYKVMQMCESIKICYLIVCKNIVKKFVTITLLLKELMTLLRGGKM